MAAETHGARRLLILSKLSALGGFAVQFFFKKSINP